MAGVRKNLVGSIYLAFANGGAQLVLVPVLLHFWGTELYADWLVIFTIPALFAFADVGIVNSVCNHVTLAVERGDHTDATAKINAAWKFQAIASLLITLFISLLAIFGPLKQWLGISQISQSSLAVTCCLLALYAGISLQTGIISAHYRAAGTYSRYLFWMATMRIVEVILICLLSTFSKSTSVVALAILTLKITSVFVLIRLTRSQLTSVQFKLLSGNWSDFIPLLKPGINFLTFTLSQAVINQGSILAVNHVLNSHSVVLLSVCRQLARLFQLGVAVIETAVLPEITRAYGAGAPKRALSLQHKALLVPLILGPIYILICTFFGNSIITLWTNKDLNVANILLFACSLETVLFGLCSLAIMVAWGTNNIKRLSQIQIAGVIAAIIIGTLGLPKFGLISIPFSFALLSLIVSIKSYLTGLNILNIKFST